MENLNSEIVLGDKFYNPFTIEEVQSRSAAGTQIIANYVYFRCRTENQEALKWLSENNVYLSTIPLDREIIEGGTVFNNAGDGEDCWYYFTKSLEDFIEIKNHGFELEVLEEMYLDDEDLAVLRGEWLESTDGTCITVDNTENSQARGIWSAVKKIKKILQKYVANCPTGKVTVYDPVTGDYVPVKGVQIIANQLLATAPTYTYTDDEGNFKIPVFYTSLGGQVQIILRFQNASISIQDFSWNIETNIGTAVTGAVVYCEGSHWIENISDMKIQIKESKSCAKYATVMNAHADFIDFCEEYDMTKPEPLNVIVNSKIQNACTTLSRYGGRELILTAATTLEPVTGLTISASLMPLMPDIIIGTKTNTSLEDTYSSMLHELSHTTHYFGLGASGKDVWIREYIDMLSGWGEMIKEGKSPFDDCYNEGGTDLIKLIESWGYFSENYLMWQKHKDFIIKDTENERTYTLGDTYRDKLENNYLTGKEYFYYGGLYDLTYINASDEEENRVDFCENYSYSEIYEAIITNGVIDLKNFAKALTENTGRIDDYDNVINTLNSNYKKD